MPAPLQIHPLDCPAPRRRLFAWVLLLAISWPFGGTTHISGASDSPPSEYEVKAALLLNFAQFIQWPASAFPDPRTPITIGILGDDPFGRTLDQTIAGQTVQGRSFRITRSHQIEDLRGCHMLFVCRSERSRIGQILASASDSSCVTIADMEGFAQRGGVINFYDEDEKVRFEVNVSAAERKGLKIGAQLLKRARVIGSSSQAGRS